MNSVFRFLSTHPTRRAGVNWTVWVLVLVVLVAAGSAQSGSKSTPVAGGRAPAPVGSAALVPSSATGISPANTSTTAHLGVTKPAARNPSTKASATGRTRPGDVVRGGVVLPNRRRTPGAVNPAVTQATIGSTICVVGWTAIVRPASSYTTGLKVQQLASGYAYDGDTSPGDYEEDHLISLELGGSPTAPANLWPQPYAAAEGARIKDRIENKLHALVCAHQVSLAAAQRAIASNWWAAYRDYEGTTVVAAAPHTTSHSTTPPPAPAAGAPSAATGICNDGTYSYAAHHQGMCSHHGGVREFLD